MLYELPIKQLKFIKFDQILELSIIEWGQRMNKLLELKGISKSFPGVRALDQIQLDLEPGEVHVLIGENGAGKSTLMKIISGAYEADEGRLLVDGKEVKKNSPVISEQLGIGMIYQELNLIPELSVAQNIFLGHPLKKGFLNDDKTMNREAKTKLEQLHISLNPSRLVKSLGVGTQQMIEIVKALSREARILVFDEPASSLADAEIKELFSVIRMLKNKGIGMFYISHRLEEIFEIGDRVTIMRDGKKISSDKISDTNMNKLIEGIAGRKIENLYPHTRKNAGEVKLEIRNLTGRKFQDVPIKVRAGEIAGISGLVGAGRTEVARADFGIDGYDTGQVFLLGQPLKKNSPRLSVSKGFCLLPENRKEEGLALARSISENVIISSLDQTFTVRAGGLGVVKQKEEDRIVEGYMDSLKISAPTARKLARFLSGGTQQKVVLAKWLASRCQVFIFDEPTRGIDVGAKSEIYRLMDSLVENGAAILMISSDLPEILGISDRIYVMCGGRLKGEFDVAEATQEKILHLAFGQTGEEEKNEN